METGIELIAKERQRQMDEEGWSPAHDSLHKQDELARAAATYALPPRFRALNGNGKPPHWPFSLSWWKPTAGTKEGRIRELVKAGSLIAADIDRLNDDKDYV